MIDKVLVLTPDPRLCAPFVRSGKVEIGYLPRRATVADYVAMTRSIVRPALDDLVIMINGDIVVLDEGVELATTALRRDECWALARWERVAGGPWRASRRNDSQDSWWFRWPFREHVRNLECLRLGVQGVDNRLAFELQRGGYRVTNPVLSVVTHHLHRSRFRTYQQGVGEKVGPPYLRLPPVGIDGIVRGSRYLVV